MLRHRRVSLIFIGFVLVCIGAILILLVELLHR